MIICENLKEKRRQTELIIIYSDKRTLKNWTEKNGENI